MKAARVLLIGVGALVVLLLVGLTVALNSSFQTWAARRALSAHPDFRGSLGSLSAGFGHVEIRDLRLRRGGAVLTVPSLETDLPLIPAALERVHIRRLVARGWTLDLTRASGVTVVDTDMAAVTLPRRPTRIVRLAEPRGFSLLPSAYAAEPAAVAAAGAFRGLFPELELPVDLSVEGVQLEGEVILPGIKGENPVRTRVILKGGGLAAGREGSFSVDVSAAQGDGGSLAGHANLVAAMDTPRTFTRIGADGHAAVSGTQFPEGVTIDVTAGAVRTTTGETYSLLLARGETQLAAAEAELVRATSRVNGSWKLDLQDADLVPFALGRRLPVFTAVGEGSFVTGPTFDEVHASGRLRASADRLDALRPELAAVGSMDVTADFDLLQHGSSVRVERLTAEVMGAAPVASIRALQPFEFNLGTAELRVADPAKNLVGLSLTRVPVEWARPFLGGLQLTGGVIRGELVASAREGGLALRTQQPLSVTGLSASHEGKPLLREIDLTFTASADYTPRGWQASLPDLSVTHRGTTLLSLEAKAGQLSGGADQAVKITGRWRGDLPGWLTQPVIGGELPLTSGTARGEFNASLDGTKSVETRLAVEQLVAATNEPLPSLTVEVRADIGPDERITFKAPLVARQDGRTSDLLLSGSFTAGEPAVLEARLSGDVVYLQDVRPLLVLLPGDTGESDARKPDESEKGPPWAGVTGQITLALKKVVYGESFEATDVAGTVRLGPDALRFDGVHATFGPESDLRFEGGVGFNPAAADPYSLNGELALRNFETAPVFRAIDPAKLPTLEATVDVNSRITGEAASLADLAERTQGDFQVTSKGGVFRALSTVLPAERMQTTQSALAIVGGLFGGSTAETANATIEIVRILSEISFDQLSLKAERGTSLDLLLQDFTLISPNVRLSGEGKLDYVPGRSLLEQALDLRINLGARGRLGELLEQVKMLKAEKDSLGYSAFSTPIKIGGTLAQTDTSDLRTKLLNVAVEKSGVGEALNRILGGGKQ